MLGYYDEVSSLPHIMMKWVALLLPSQNEYCTMSCGNVFQSNMGAMPYLYLT